MKDPVRVAVTGAAGQIGYALLFRIASGQMLGHDQPVILQLLEITPGGGGARGRRAWSSTTAPSRCWPASCAPTTPTTAFGDADYAPARRRHAPQGGHGARRPAVGQRRHLHRPGQGDLGRGGAATCKILVVGNPANTNALIAMNNAADTPDRQFTAMTRLDHNRAMAQLAAKAGARGQRRHPHDDLGQPLGDAVPRRVPRRGGGQARRSTPSGGDQAWLEGEFIPTVQQRGAAIIKARGLSSAASAANAAVDHVRSWALGTPEGDWVSMAVPSDGSYGVPEGLIVGFPCTCSGGEYEIVQGLEHRRLQPGPHRRLGGRARRRARRGQGPRPDLTSP